MYSKFKPWEIIDVSNFTSLYNQNKLYSSKNGECIFVIFYALKEGGSIFYPLNVWRK